MFHWFRKHTKDGLEKPDVTPLNVPLDRPLSLAEQIARFCRDPEAMAAARSVGMDTFDEADDFDTGDLEDQDKSPYEVEFNGKEIELAGVQTRLDENRAGMVEEMPESRRRDANDRLERGFKKGGKPEADLPPKEAKPD